MLIRFVVSFTVTASKRDIDQNTSRDTYHLIDRRLSIYYERLPIAKIPARSVL